MRLISFLVIMLSMSMGASARDFFATPALLASHPGAFAATTESLPFHAALEVEAQERIELVSRIRQAPGLLEDLQGFGKLPLVSQIKVLRRLFEIECDVLGIVPPELVIDESSITGHAFFEFDLAAGGAGKVYLNKAKLAEEEDKTQFILLLLHETRHSGQFQRAQRSDGPLGAGFRRAFEVQRDLRNLGHRWSFCDFMLLLNEYEAFQFANFVYGDLVGWTTPITDLGTLASQYDESGRLRLNLRSLLEVATDPVAEFNRYSRAQYEVIYE